MNAENMSKYDDGNDSDDFMTIKGIILITFSLFSLGFRQSLTPAPFHGTGYAPSQRRSDGAS
ncbi:hypothetical protein NQ318_003792 [Aromia moschata]|uniref:Uncharacterized protein n=1 Tax=Aromia moschata TaxID=1265417 RepID=A0AAV8YKN9_9CUCU|nr:hypothetical protein NQ318_003792 [Aromia moschata]